MNTEEFLKRISENKLHFENITFDIEVNQSISNCNFVGCDFTDSRFYIFINCRFDRCDFTDNRSMWNILERCYFVKCNFDMARMSGNYKKCVWFDCSITFADNFDSHFDSNSFFDCQFESGCLDSAMFSNCDLVNTRFADFGDDQICFDKTAIINVSIEGKRLANNSLFSKQF